MLVDVSWVCAYVLYYIYANAKNDADFIIESLVTRATAATAATLEVGVLSASFRQSVTHSACHLW